MICNKCKTDMINDCDVKGYMGIEIMITKKRKGMFNNSKDSLKACVCPNCGNVEFYIKNYADFIDENK